MDRSKAGIISFAVILLILAIFGVEFYSTPKMAKISKMTANEIIPAFDLSIVTLN